MSEPGFDYGSARPLELREFTAADMKAVLRGIYLFPLGRIADGRIVTQNVWTG